MVRTGQVVTRILQTYMMDFPRVSPPLSAMQILRLLFKIVFLVMNNL
jgi:hypothetical protein